MALGKLGGAICATFLWLAVSAFPVFADVTGNFNIDVVLLPEGTQTEAVKYDIDLRSNLTINVTLSGIVFGADTGFGNTGPEFSIASITTTLGPILMFNQVVFAAPFYNATQNVPPTGQDLVVTTDIFGRPNGLAFVKARFNLDFNVAGFTISNLAILEDVDFPDPNTYSNPIYFINELDNIVDIGGTGAVNQTPTMGFGNVITLQGQTRNRVTITGSTALCVRPKINRIKGRSWPESVDIGCRDQVFFSFETLSISGITIAGVELDVNVFWAADEPVQTSIIVGTRLLDIADVELKLQSDNITKLSVNQLSLKVVSGQLDIQLLDLGGDLTPDQVLFTLATVLNANQNPASLILFALLSNPEGLAFIEPTLIISRGDLFFTTSTAFEGNGLGGLQWQATRFSLSVSTPSYNLALSTNIKNGAMSETSISFGMSF
jgi:hypothetical protein